MLPGHARKMASAGAAVEVDQAGSSSSVAHWDQQHWAHLLIGLALPAFQPVRNVIRTCRLKVKLG